MVFKTILCVGRDSILIEMLLSTTYPALNLREAVPPEILQINPPPPASHFPCPELHSNGFGAGDSKLRKEKTWK